MYYKAFDNSVSNSAFISYRAKFIARASFPGSLPVKLQVHRRVRVRSNFITGGHGMGGGDADGQLRGKFGHHQVSVVVVKLENYNKGPGKVTRCIFVAGLFILCLVKTELRACRWVEY